MPNLLTIPPFMAGVVWAVLQGGYVLHLTLFTLSMVINLWVTDKLGGMDGKVLVVLATTGQLGLVGATAGMVIWAFIKNMRPHIVLPGIFFGVLVFLGNILLLRIVNAHTYILKNIFELATHYVCVDQNVSY
jgi:hypothetical protein